MARPQNLPPEILGELRDDVNRLFADVNQLIEAGASSRAAVLNDPITDRAVRARARHHWDSKVAVNERMTETRSQMKKLVKSIEQKQLDLLTIEGESERTTVQRLISVDQIVVDRLKQDLILIHDHQRSLAAMKVYEALLASVAPLAKKLNRGETNLLLVATAHLRQITDCSACRSRKNGTTLPLSNISLATDLNNKSEIGEIDDDILTRFRDPRAGGAK